MSSTTLAPGSQTVLERDAQLDDAQGHERLSHYVSREKLTEAMVMGTPVVALCGKIWVPTRNPENYPVCQECKEIWESMPEQRG